MGIGEWIEEFACKILGYDPVNESRPFEVKGYMDSNINSKVIITVDTDSGFSVVANLFYEENCRQMKLARKGRKGLPPAFDGQINGCIGPEGVARTTIDSETLEEVTTVLDTRYPIQGSWAEKARSYRSPVGFDPQPSY